MLLSEYPASRAQHNIERFDQSRDFYVGLLGFEVAMNSEWIMTFASPTNPTAQLSVMKEDATAKVHPNISIEVSDVDSVYARALERGEEIAYPLADEAWGVRRFFVGDRNGVGNKCFDTHQRLTIAGDIPQ